MFAHVAVGVCQVSGPISQDFTCLCKCVLVVLKSSMISLISAIALFLVDGTFCQAALKGKIQIKEQLPKYLGAPVQLGQKTCFDRLLQSDHFSSSPFTSTHFFPPSSLPFQVTTRCVVAELVALGPQLSGAVFIAKRFQQRVCGHKKSKPATDCIMSLIGEECDVISNAFQIAVPPVAKGRTIRTAISLLHKIWPFKSC